MTARPPYRFPKSRCSASFPELAGLTRLTDKRHVLRDRADVLCTTEEGIKGRRALDWGLVDKLIPRSKFQSDAIELVKDAAATTDRPAMGGIDLGELARSMEEDAIRYSTVEVEIDRTLGTAAVTIKGPVEAPPEKAESLSDLGVQFWPLAMTRELDDALLHLRLNEPELGTLLFRTAGDRELVAAYDGFLLGNGEDWLVRETVLYLNRTLKRLDMTARTVVTLIEPDSCFVGLLAEIPLASDRVYMYTGTGGPYLRLTQMNLGPVPMGNGLSRLATRFWGRDEELALAEKSVGRDLDASEADGLGLVTFAFDDVDWHDEVRLFLEERGAFSPDALTGLEANLRLAGPETMETKIFGRLTAWQNWIFFRPNASGPEGTLRSYGTGRRPGLDRRRT